MTTPPKYPFRSRREIHSGQPKVYSDAPNEEQVATPSDPDPHTGARYREASSGLVRPHPHAGARYREASSGLVRPHPHAGTRLPYPQVDA